MNLETVWRAEDGARLAATVWRAGDGYRMISSAMLGGGAGRARWVLNAQVAGGYSRMDPVAHLEELAASYGLEGPGVGMLTAASVSRTMRRDDGGVHASATVGLRVPTWAAAPADRPDPELAPIHLDGASPPAWSPGTINIVVAVPVPLSDAALVNAVMTVTEAKTQALLEAGYPCTGTASDAVCIAARTPGRTTEDGKAVEVFAGPRSVWGARIARAVHAAVHAGAVDYTAYLSSRNRQRKS
ncbi:adenosylcobinamide amidohydrolase [Actinomadura livida]|uniref:Adenosylcobinamide amidohydrolase n=1 Tax=Actinomadura livida TaxID=79909 RepID=A0A7W7IFF1_9ACTN|nr:MULTISPECIES: adenosylcobinamide amidohydrolase [Actinomadura]MBB4776128.1 adenosylcobinamide amidohydrolase [Actinomadura catellatispora]GGU15303.1 adenosylcobinamide amidohydrolase [Actinomadura livida]